MIRVRRWVHLQEYHRLLHADKVPCHPSNATMMLALYNQHPVIAFHILTVGDWWGDSVEVRRYMN